MNNIHHLFLPITLTGAISFLSSFFSTLFKKIKTRSKERITPTNQDKFQYQSNSPFVYPLKNGEFKLSLSTLLSGSLLPFKPESFKVDEKNTIIFFTYHTAIDKVIIEGLFPNGVYKMNIEDFIIVS